jgi:hypothetical protein
MSRTLLVLWGLVSNAIRKKSLRRLLFISVLLVLSLVSTIQPIPARAAVPSLSATPYLSSFGVDVHAPPGPFCPKNDYSFRAALVRTDFGAIQGHILTRRVFLAPELLSASVSDPSVGTISPPNTPGRRAYSGFKFHAIKSGYTDLKFTADSLDPDVPGRPSRTQTVEVTDCIYRITMTYDYSLRDQGLTITLTGVLVTTLDLIDDQYTGYGSFAFRPTGYLAADPDCAATGNFYSFSFPTDIHGDIENNKLKLNFAFRPAEEVGTAVSCKTIDLLKTTMDMNRAGISSAKGPASGWTDQPRIRVPGKLYLTVERIARRN